MTRFPFPPLRLRNDPGSESRDEEWDRYLASCSDYLKRQILVYQNWPQRRWNSMGYTEKVFTDLNA